MIQQEENHKQLMQGRKHHPESSMAFAVKAKMGGGKKNACRHCGCYGHEEASCYEIIRHPSSWGTRDHERGGRGRRGARGRGGRRRGAGWETAKAVVQHEAAATPV